MGYDARVPCNCWKLGKCKPLPPELEGIPISFEEGFFKLDLEYPPLDAPQELKDEFHEKDYLFDTWLETCCDHPNMEYFGDRVANISGMASFRWALAQVGNDHFPTVVEELPVANGGNVPLERVPQFLAELEFFRQQPEIAKTLLLVDEATKQPIQEYQHNREGVFKHDIENGVDIGFDEQGFFIVKRHEQVAHVASEMLKKEYHIHQPREELFRAILFEKRRLPDGSIQYLNLDTGTSYTMPSDKGGEFLHGEGRFSLDEGEQSRIFRIYSHIITPDYYSWIVDTLMKLCHAALEMQNPIYWY